MEEEFRELNNLVNANDENMQLFEYLSDQICYKNLIKSLRRQLDYKYSDALGKLN